MVLININVDDIAILVCGIMDLIDIQEIPIQEVNHVNHKDTISYLFQNNRLVLL